MKKQELELQLRTEKEREEGECRPIEVRFTKQTSSELDTVVLSKKVIHQDQIMLQKAQNSSSFLKMTDIVESLHY